MSVPAGFSRYGAVDLGALAARNAAPTGPAATAAGGASSADQDGLVIDVTEASFEAEVVQRSMTVPVVIDLWATWCQPCKTLSPVLEELARADAGAWLLAKIDIDANPRIAQAFQVQSIPAVFAVVKGQPVPLFQGALPEAEVRQYLDELLRVAAANGVTGRVTPTDPAAPAPEPAEEVLDPRHEAAYAAFESGDYAGAAAAFQSLLDQAPGDAEARAGLLQAQLLARTDGLDPDAVLAAAAAAPDDLAAQGLAADVELLGGLVEAAFGRLTDLVRCSAGEDREAARQHLVDLFEVLGSDDVRVTTARRQLARALY